MKLLRILALLVFPALAAIGARSADSAPPSTAGCEQIALHLRSGGEDGDSVPLDIRVGGRSMSVRFGVGRACGAGS